VSTVKSNRQEVLKAAITQGGKNVNDLCEIMAMEAKHLSPVFSGNNKDSIAYKAGVEKGKVFGRVFTESGYGGWLEIGTARMPARPYFAPAYTMAMRQVKA
jgi:HK97 gp10 family phage protein